MRAAALRAPLGTRAVLMLVALTYVGVMLLLPLGAVLFEALRKGIGLWWAAISDPDARSAIRLTLIVAAISVPLNTVFGVAAAWAISKYNFAG